MAILDLFKKDKPAEIGQEEQPINALQQPRVGTVGKIGEQQIKKAADILRKYKQGKANLETRIIDNEQWYKMRHWEQIRKTENTTNNPEPASAWLFNSIANKHADAMDNFPAPSVLPREASDKDTAQQLSKILPVVLEYNDFEQTYSDTWWYKLKTGTGAYGVFWNPQLENGLGDIDIKQLDILNLFWEPGIKDIQKSKNLFTVELVDNEILIQSYPELNGKLKSATVDVAKYIYDDTVDTSEKSAVIDWYYKMHNEGGGTVLHYCKFVNNTVLYASENDPSMAERGFYDHGEYPVVFDTMFVEEGTPCGFGYVDVMKDTQMYIDKLNQAIIKNAIMTSKPRYFIKSNGDVNEQEFADWSKDFVHVQSGNLGDDSLKPIDVPRLDSSVVQIMQLKVDELKETSGNRDFSQGGTSGGVTAASAIAALQEAGSKLSRDMIKSSYRAFSKINYLCIELIRQFYDEPRMFRITGEQGEQEFVPFSNAPIKPQEQGAAYGIEGGLRKPVFDISVTSQKSSPFSKIAQNELAKELYGAGLFNPEMTDQALIVFDMMDFEGKDTVIQKVAQNGTMLQTIMQMQTQMQQMAAIIDATQGTQLAPAMAAQMGGAPEAVPVGNMQAGQAGTMADKATTQAQQAATPR
jgi:peptidyl-tRNA hydrolase